jgi:hypothetical protein
MKPEHSEDFQIPGNNQSELNLETDCIHDYFNDIIINDGSKNPLAV